MGPQEPPYRLNCPPLTPGPPLWQKDCRPLPAQEGKAYLEFASFTLEDQGNYTCVARGNSTASSTIRLIVTGTYDATLEGVKGDGGGAPSSTAPCPDRVPVLRSSGVPTRWGRGHVLQQRGLQGELQVHRAAAPSTSRRAM